MSDDYRRVLSDAVQRQVRIHGGLTIEAIGDAVADVFAPYIARMMKAAILANNTYGKPKRGIVTVFDRLRDENVQMHVQLNRIRALHQQYRDVYATDETGDSCAHCNTFTDAWRVPWPCPTIQALDDPVFPAPDKETEPGYRPVLLDISRDETRHPRGADGRWETR